MSTLLNVDLSSIVIPIKYVDKNITLKYSIEKTDYKAVGEEYPKDTTLTLDDIQNSDYYYICLNHKIESDGSTLQIAIRCNDTARDFIYLISDNTLSYKQIISDIYNRYKDDEDVVSGGVEFICKMVNDFLDKLDSENLLSITDLPAAPPIDDNLIVEDSNFNTTLDTEESFTSGPLLGAAPPVTLGGSNPNSSNSSTATEDEPDIPTPEKPTVIPTDEEMFEDLSDRYSVNYDYSFRLKYGFTVTQIGENWYAMPDKEETTGRWFVKGNYACIVGFNCFKSLTNRQRIIDTLKAAFPNEPEIPPEGEYTIEQVATHIYNMIWFNFNQANPDA